LVEIRLLGPVLSYWMERLGLLALHASAVGIGQRAIGFLASHGGGKSGLAAGLMRYGHPLLTDDILPVEERDGTFFGRPGYPQMRMWPDAAAHFLGDWEELPLVLPEIAKRRVPVGPALEGGFGSFHPDSLPITALYVPERRQDGPIEIREVLRSEGLLELVRHSFSPRLVEAAGLQPRRFDLFARLVQRVPIRRLVYPSGFHRLPEVAEAVLRDLDRLPC